MFILSTALSFYQPQNVEGPDLTNKRTGIMRFQVSDLFLVIFEVRLRGLGVRKIEQNHLK